jgi:hypothetical protein
LFFLAFFFAFFAAFFRDFLTMASMHSAMD